MRAIDERLLGGGPLVQEADSIWGQHYTEIGVPMIYRGAHLEGDRSGVVRMRDFMGTWGKCLLLLGDPGVGKTFAAAAALRHDFYYRPAGDRARSDLHGPRQSEVPLEPAQARGSRQGVPPLRVPPEVAEPVLRPGSSP